MTIGALDWAMDETRAIIDRLQLQPHPEGGWYRETWRAAAVDGARGAGTAILYLLAAGERSHWHRVDATEIWMFQAGAPLLLRTATDDAAAPVTTRLGPDILAGEQPQFTVQPREWQAAEPTGAWSLMACVVVPAFDFAGFELAPPDWAPGR
jgi:predicted cupin superfamily sugar epimerase